MNSDILVTELTKLYNLKLFSNKRINGLVIKIYKKFRKELHKYNCSAIKETQFHKDIATYAAGMIGYFAQSKKLSKYNKVKFDKAYEKLKIIKTPYIPSVTTECPDESLLFSELSLFDQTFNLNNSYCAKVFRILQKIYLLKRNQNQNPLGVSHVELLTMSAYFNFWPKPKNCIKDWTTDFYGSLCLVHPSIIKEQVNFTYNSQLKINEKGQVLNEVGENTQEPHLSNKEIKGVQTIKRAWFWSWFRK